MKKIARILSFVLALMAYSSLSQAQIGGWDPDAEEKALETVETFTEKDPGLERFFEEAYGYAVMYEASIGGQKFKFRARPKE